MGCIFGGMWLHYVHETSTPHQSTHHNYIHGYCICTASTMNYIHAVNDNVIQLNGKDIVNSYHAHNTSCAMCV